MELGISGKTLREWLRDTFPRPEADFHRPWFLTPEQVTAARARFPGPRRAASREGMITTTVALPESTHGRLAEVSEETGTPLTELLRQAAGEWVSKYPPNRYRHVRDGRAGTHLHIRFLDYSRRFITAAQDLSAQGGEGWRYPVPHYLACHAIELALKAHLIHRGMGERALVGIGHDLVACLARATAEVRGRLASQHVAAIDAINPDYSGHRLRYATGSTGVMRSAPPIVLLIGAAQLLVIDLDRQFRAERRR